MTKVFYPFDAGAGANVTEDQWRKMAQLWLPSGTAASKLNGLETFADSTGMVVKVKSGQAWVLGHFFESDAQESLAIGTANPTNPRDDLVVVRADFTANTVDLAVLQGTPAGSPTPPALTQTSSRWEIALAKIRVDAAAATIAAGKVTDQRLAVVTERSGGMIARASVTSAQGSLGVGPTDLTGLSITATTYPGRLYRLSHYCQGFSSTASPETWSLVLAEGGTQLTERNIHIPTSGVGAGGGTAQVLLTPTPGSHTYKARASRATGSGTGTHLCGATAPAYIMLEDVGPA